MWLLSHTAFEAFKAALESRPSFTDAQIADFEARAGGAQDGSRISARSGRIAQIQIDGMITAKPDFFARMFGGGNVTYPEITAAVAAADSDDAVERIQLNIDSPGGTVAGLFEALAALQATKKPIDAVVAGQASSAAYAIAAQAEKITATNRAATFGSVGVLVRVPLDSDHTATLTSTNAPNKAPDASTKEGAAVIVQELDALHELYVEAIADGRGTDVKTVNSQFGQGGVLLADEALKRGMIDEVAAPQLRPVGRSVSSTAHRGGNTSEASRKMDLQTLRAEHPDVYAAAVELGTTQERDRVTAHAIFGEQTGATEIALKAIKEGSEMNATFQATYMTAGLNRTDVAARSADDAAAGGAADGAAAAADDDARDLAASAKLAEEVGALLNIDMEV